MAAYYKNVGNTVRVFEAEPAEKKKPAVKVKKRRSVMFVYKNDHKHKIPAATVITLLLIFTGAGGIAAASANVTMANKQAVALSNELREKLSQNKDLEEQANQYEDAADMKKKAEALGMSVPELYQYLHINVPDANYAEYVNNDK